MHRREHEPVVLVHGIWNTAKVFRSLARQLSRAGFEVHAWDSSPNNGSVSLFTLAQQLSERVDTALGAERKFSLIGFSMGGIVSRLYLQRLGGARRVRKFVSIASPHYGTFWGRLGKKPGVREMRPGSELLAELNRGLGELSELDCLSLYTPLDLMILPTKSSNLGLGEARTFSVAAHQLMLNDSRVARATIEFLNRA